MLNQVMYIVYEARKAHFFVVASLSHSRKYVNTVWIDSKHFAPSRISLVFE